MNKMGLNNISVIFGIVMVLLLLSGSVAFTFTNFMMDSLYGQKRVFFVILLLSYSAYRIFRIYQVIKGNRDTE